VYKTQSYVGDDDDEDFYSVTLAFRQTTGNKADGGSSSGDFYSVAHAFRQTTGNKADGGQ
jgi:hypothetical protein